MITAQVMKNVTTHKKAAKFKKTSFKRTCQLVKKKKNLHTGESTLKKKTSFQLTNSSLEDKNLAVLLPHVRALC
jgi:hypothetical protein